MGQDELLIIDGILLLGHMNKFGGQDPVAFIPNYVKDIGAEVFLSEDVEVEKNNPFLYSENGCVYRRGIGGDTLIVFSGEFEKSWDDTNTSWSVLDCRKLYERLVAITEKVTRIEKYPRISEWVLFSFSKQ